MIYIWLDTEFSGGVERKKNPIDFDSRNEYFYPKKTISLLNEDMKKRGGQEKVCGRKTQRGIARYVAGHKKWIEWRFVYK